jgi:hyperosmotically inducible periplasmic protein
VKYFIVAKLNRYITIGAVCIVSCSGISLLAQQDATQSQQSSDNTKVNKRDRKTAEPTADQAKNTLSDRETMRKIRQAVVADHSLSTYAHNVKIISQAGKVTLKGPVHTEDEKRMIEAKATEVAGEGNVTNEITVKGDSK